MRHQALPVECLPLRCKPSGGLHSRPEPPRGGCRWCRWWWWRHRRWQCHGWRQCQRCSRCRGVSVRRDSCSGKRAGLHRSSAKSGGRGCRRRLWHRGRLSAAGGGSIDAGAGGTRGFAKDRGRLRHRPRHRLRDRCLHIGGRAVVCAEDSRGGGASGSGHCHNRWRGVDHDTCSRWCQLLHR